MKSREYLKLLAQIELSRNEFWYFCRTVCPSFYKEERKYLKELCYQFQRFYETNDYTTMVISIGPRHGKTLTCKLFIRWILGKNKQEKVILASYNTTLSGLSSKEIRDAIMEEKIELNKIVNSDIFDTQIKRGSSSAKMWKVEGANTISFLATAPKSTVTGLGSTWIVVDDILKNAEEAYNDVLLDKIWDWWTNTMISRGEPNHKKIFIATRWAKGDLSGRILDHCERTGEKVLHVNYRLEQEDGTILPGSPLTPEAIQNLKSLMSEEIFSANYNQEPLDSKDRLYLSLNTYKEKGQIIRNVFGEEYEPDNCARELPQQFQTIRAYIDTADGGDYLCCIIYGIYNNEIYVLDVVYTQLPMVKSVGIVAERLHTMKVAWCDVEANNGGEGYAIELTRILNQTFDNYWTHIHSFSQTENKEARIRSKSGAIQRLMFFPCDYISRWKDYSQAMLTYKNIGKNKNDDAPDATTGAVEKSIEYGYIKWIA